MAHLVSVWIANPAGSATHDQTIPANTAVDVVLDCEGSGVELAAGVSFSVGAIAINLSANPVAQINLAPKAGTPAFGVFTPGIGLAGVWPTSAQEFRWTLPANFGVANNIIMVIAFLNVGNPAVPPLLTQFGSTYMMRVV